MIPIFPEQLEKAARAILKTVLPKQWEYRIGVSEKPEVRRDILGRPIDQLGIIKLIDKYREHIRKKESQLDKEIKFSIKKKMQEGKPFAVAEKETLLERFIAGKGARGLEIPGQIYKTKEGRYKQMPSVGIPIMGFPKAFQPPIDPSKIVKTYGISKKAIMKSGNFLVKHLPKTIKTIVQRAGVKAPAVSPQGLVDIIKKAKDTRAAIPKKIGNINLTKYPPDVARKIYNIVAPHTEELAIQGRGVQTFSEIAKRAAKTGPKVIDELVAAEPGTTMPAEKIVAARKEIADAVLDATGEDLEKIYKATKGLAGVTKETARALSSYRISVDPEKIRKLIERADKTKDSFTRKKLVEVANVLAGREKAPGLIDKFIEWALAIKLTGYRTPIRALIGNAFGRLFTAPEKFVAGTIDWTRHLIVGGKRYVYASEAIGDVLGNILGIKSATKNAVRALIDENYAMAQQRVREATPMGGAIRGKLGKTIRLSFRAVSAPDAFFRTLGERAETYSQAIQKALDEGNTIFNPDKLIDRIVDLSKKPPSKLAQKRASEQVFQKELEGIWNGLNKLRNKFPAIKIIIPFFKTPVNLMRFAIQRSPLAAIDPVFWQAIKRGGRSREIAISRVLVGAGTMTYLTFKALEGKITGPGPSNRAERDALYRQGWQPYSIKFGDRYYSYRGLEPLSTFLATSATIAEQVKAPSSASAMKSMLGISRNMLDQPYLMGVSQLLEIMEDPNPSDSTINRMLGWFIAGQTIPVGTSYIRIWMDSYRRQPEGLLQELKTKIPGVSKTVPPKRNVWGEPISYYDDPWQAVSPIIYTKERDDKTEKELSRLGITPSLPVRSIRGFKIPQDLYNRYLELSGKVAKKALDVIVDSEDYYRLSDKDKEKVVDGVIREVRLSVRETVEPKVFRDYFSVPDTIPDEIIVETLKQLTSMSKFTRLSEDEKKQVFQKTVDSLMESL